MTLLASSTANDQLSEYDIGFNGITLTNQAGKTVTLATSFVGQDNLEFIRLNGLVEPLFTAAVPQDTYVSATALISGAEFACVAYDSAANQLATSTYAYIPLPASHVTVNLPSPITVSGSSMGLSLNLQVSPSASWGSCAAGGATNPYTVTPTFNLTPVSFSSEPTSVTNGKFVGLSGVIGSVDLSNDSFVIELTGGPDFFANFGSSTVFQGIASASALVAGMPVSMDAEMEANGFLQATRIEVYDTNPTDMSVVSGPLNFVGDTQPVMYSIGQQQQGFLFTSSSFFGELAFSFGSAVFQTSRQLTNLGNLPFTPAFTAANMVPGQVTTVSTQATRVAESPLDIPASTLTLVPQTINGTIAAVSSAGSFTTYTVTLAPYDLIANLAVQQGQAALLKNPNTVVVYVDSSAQLLNTTPLNVGNVMRFNGLLFNDGGTLRMDCAQVNDGVAE